MYVEAAFRKHEGEMKRILSVCLSYLNPNMRDEMKRTCPSVCISLIPIYCLSVLLKPEHQDGIYNNLFCPSICLTCTLIST